MRSCRRHAWQALPGQALLHSVFPAELGRRPPLSRLPCFLSRLLLACFRPCCRASAMRWASLRNGHLCSVLVQATYRLPQEWAIWPMHRFLPLADRPMRLRPLRALATWSASYHGSTWAATSHECWRSTRRCRPMLVRLFQGRALPPIVSFQPWYYPYANTNRRRGPRTAHPARTTGEV